MFERFTDRARRVLVLAQEEASLLGHGFIGTEHILLGLVAEGDGLAAQALESLDISLDAVRMKVEEHIGPAAGPPSASPPFTPRAKKVLELSLREALQLGHNYIGTEHLLLGIVREGEGVGAIVLIGLGADLARVRERVIELLSGYEGKHAVTVARTARAERRTAGRAARFPAPVGKQWTAQVVRAGRMPEDTAMAYAELTALAEAHGLTLGELDPLQIELSSIETSEGPGLLLSVTVRIDDEEAGSDGPAADPDTPKHPSS
jgi:ATP-dependent Clp protease ATP-binding subunit ClpA